MDDSESPRNPNSARDRSFRSASQPHLRQPHPPSTSQPNPPLSEPSISTLHRSHSEKTPRATKSVSSSQKVQLPPMPHEVEEKSRSDLVQPFPMDRDALHDKHPPKTHLPPIDLQKVAQLQKEHIREMISNQEARQSHRGVKDRVFSSRNSRPDNAWGYGGTRAQIQHLLDNSVCQCGIGNGFSYLAERKKKVPDEEHPEPRGRQGFDSVEPETLTFISHPGSCPLHVEANKYTVDYVGHPSHDVYFPNLRPTNADQLRTVEENFETAKSRIDATLQDIDSGKYTSEYVCQGDSEYEFDSSAFMEGFVALMKQEQDVYSESLYELLCQVTVECAERGAILSRVRKGCLNTLTEAPKRVMPVYEELLAQRVFARRLENELKQFREESSRLKEENTYLSTKVDELQLFSTNYERTTKSLEKSIQDQQEAFQLVELAEEKRRKQLEAELINLRHLRRKTYEEKAAQLKLADEEITAADIRDKEAKIYKMATELSNVTADENKQRLIYFSSSHESFKSFFVQYSAQIIDLVIGGHDKMVSLLAEFSQLKQLTLSDERIPFAKTRYSTSRWREFLDDISTALMKASTNNEKNQEIDNELFVKWRTACLDLVCRVSDTEKRKYFQDESAIIEVTINDWLKSPILHSFDKLRQAIIYLASELKTYIEHVNVEKQGSFPEYLSTSDVLELRDKVDDWIKNAYCVVDVFLPLVNTDPQTQLEKISRLIDNFRWNLRGQITQETDEMEHILATIHGRLEAWTERLGSIKSFEIPSQIAELKSISDQARKWNDNIAFLNSAMGGDKKEQTLIAMEVNEFTEEIDEWVKMSIQYSRMLEIKEDDAGPMDILLPSTPGSDGGDGGDGDDS